MSTFMSTFETSRYPMQLDSDGFCGNLIIISYQHFNDPKYHTRNGASNEIRNLQKFAELLCLKPHVFSDLPKRELQKTLDYIANPPKSRPDHVSETIWDARIKPDHKIFMVAILSHGDADSFLTTDGVLFRDTDIDLYLDEDRCPLMKDKPKVVLFNKCRTQGEHGSNAMRGNILHSSSTNSNILHIYSCSMGTQSLRSSDTGSFIISALPEEYEKYGRGKEFRKFFQIFRSRMIKEVNIKVQDSPEYANATQCITTERDSLLRDIYFPQAGLMTASDCLEEMEVEASLDLNIYTPSVEEKPKNNRLKFLRRAKTPRVLRSRGQKKDRLKWLLRH